MDEQVCNSLYKMSLTVMNFNRVRDLVSNLGWMNEDNNYILNPNCLSTLESLEEELLKEDVKARNVRLSLHICGAVKDDLIPILVHGRDNKILVTVTRILMSLSLPAESLLPLKEVALTPKNLNVCKQLALSGLVIKKAFLNPSASLAVVSMLRETMLKCEKHLLPLKEEECNHLKNCLILLRNVLHLPENVENEDKIFISSIADWQAVQNKLIWNLFVQGIDGALILMFNSKYRDHWIVPLALIIALIYRNQNIDTVHQSLEFISSASESSGEDEESDASKISSISLSSEPSKPIDRLSDSGCPLTSESSAFEDKESCIKCSSEHSNNFSSPLDIHKKLEKVQISDDLECKSHTKQNAGPQMKHGKSFNHHSDMYTYADNDSESSSCSDSPYHKKIKGSSLNDVPCGNSNNYSNCDSAISEAMDCNSPDAKSSDDDIFNEKRVVENLKAVQKLKSVQMQSKLSESDSSNEDFHSMKIKHRSHPPTGRRGKSPRRKNGCSPSVCMDSAYAMYFSKGRIRYPLWEKRNSVSTLIDINSESPTDDDIGFLLKEFTLSFLHSGYSDLVMKIKNLLLEGSSPVFDKSLFFWMLSYFLHLSTAVSLSLNHINDILSMEIVTYLVYECINACENMELHSSSNEVIKKYITVNLNLLVAALKEVMRTVDLYYRKPISPKDKALFNDFYGKLSESQDFRNIPLLLFQIVPINNSKQFLEDIVVLNHQVLIAIDRGSNHCCVVKKVNMMVHLKLFAVKHTIDCYRRVLENFKFNSHFLNECVFTMLHHLAGDVHSSHLLIEPLLLKTFSEILKEEIELDQYQEDLIIYILNKFSRLVQKKYLKEKQSNADANNKLSDDSSSNSSVSSHCLLFEEDDDLFWWYLQFEQDKDPISRISEHVSRSKRDILSKLQLKGFISEENFKTLEEKMKTAQDSNVETTQDEDITHISNFDDNITQLLRTLVLSGERQHLIWLQDILLEICYVKLGLSTHSPEPVPFYSIEMMLSVPLVPYTYEQRNILQDKTFLSLLQKLGVHLGSVACQMYPRIPFFWTPDVLFTIATRLGPIRKEKLKFSYEDLLLSVPNYNPITCKYMDCPTLPPLSSCVTLSSWLTAVQQSKEIYSKVKKSNAKET